jgi:uncharacterized protein (TIGR03435 family)
MRQIARASVVVASCLAFGQPASRPEFEVATVKPYDPKAPGSPPDFGPRMFTVSNFPLSSIIARGYGVREFQVTGGPAWIRSDRYDIQGKPPRPSNEDQIRLMVQGLLRDRFALQLHRDAKEIPVYALVVGKGGLKITADEGHQQPRGARYRWEGDRKSRREPRNLRCCSRRPLGTS